MSKEPARAVSTSIHAHYRTSPKDRDQSVVDIFRVRPDGKIVEHWDVVQDVPATSANDNTIVRDRWPRAVPPYGVENYCSTHV